MNSVSEPEIEYGFIGKFTDLKYTYRSDIRNRKALEENFRKKFETLNRGNYSVQVIILKLNMYYGF
jgi:type I restriction enzyme R subunit